MDPTVRLRIATRIHFGLLRHYGEDVSVASLLRGGQSAREALWVCQASEHAELVALARQLGGFLAADRAERRKALTAGAAPQDAAWGRDTSGFGLSRPAGDTVPGPATGSAGWFAAAATGLRKRIGSR